MVVAFARALSHSPYVGSLRIPIPQVEALDERVLQKMLVQFERKIVRNQEMRLKFAGDGMRFMESEVELEAAIAGLVPLAANADLYQLAVELNLVESLVGLLAHENTDIVLAVINLLHELIDLNEPSSRLFVDAMIQQQGFEALVLDLSRLDESQPDDATGVFQTLAVLENSFELHAELQDTILAKAPQLLSFLLSRIQAARFDTNRLYCTELLSMLVPHASNQEAFAKADGVEILLNVLAVRERARESAPIASCSLTLLTRCARGSAIAKSILHPARSRSSSRTSLRPCVLACCRRAADLYSNKPKACSSCCYLSSTLLSHTDASSDARTQ